MLVENVLRTHTPKGWQLSGTVHSAIALDGEQLYFTVHGDGTRWLDATGDAFLAALLMPAMALGEELVIEAPVSARLRRSARTVMDIYAAWWGNRYQPVPLRCGAPSPAVERDAPAAVGLYFTGGVDSFYSLLKDVQLGNDAEHEPCTHLLYANFEHHFGPDYERMRSRLLRAADETGRQLVVVDTNVRSLTQRVAYWPDYHGAALASVALALQGLLGRCLLAASDVYPHPPGGWGSHPVLDHLWSTERLEIVHDGAEATRTEKVARQIARSPLALETLSVCWRSQPGQNCGVCEKCLRTMASLELVGSLTRCATLPQTLDIQSLRDTLLEGESERVSMREVAADALSRGRHDIVVAIQDNLRRYPPPWTIEVGIGRTKSPGRDQGALVSGPSGDQRLGPAHRAQQLTRRLRAQARQVLSDLVGAHTPCALVSFPNHANVGDSAIWLGERALLRDVGATVVYTCDLNAFSERDLRACLPAGTILIHGGGNLGDLWPEQQDFRERIVATFPHHRIIQLPQSIHFSDETKLERARSVMDTHRDLTILLRDHRSLDVARSRFSARSLLCPDMAFGIDDDPDALGPASHDIVWLARADHESAQQTMPPRTDDVLVTDWAAGEGATPEWAARERAAAEDYRATVGGSPRHTAVADWLAALQLRRGRQLLATGRVVVTDRLHGHLLSVMHGIPHVLLDDRHGKVGSTYATWTADSQLAQWARTPREALSLARALASEEAAAQPMLSEAPVRNASQAGPPSPGEARTEVHGQPSAWGPATIADAGFPDQPKISDGLAAPPTRTSRASCAPKVEPTVAWDMPQLGQRCAR